MKSYTSFSGKVVRGENFGKTLGFPTANIERKGFSKLSCKPKFGVYAGRVVLPNKEKKKAAIVVGPTDKKGLPKLEAHILDFSDNIYGQRLTFVLEHFLRSYENFSDQKTLTEQIKKDIKESRRVLSTKS